MFQELFFPTQDTSTLTLMSHLKTTDYSDSRNAGVALSKDLICKEMEHGRKGMGGGLGGPRERKEDEESGLRVW